MSAPPWPALLSSLTETVSSWGAWKGIESALVGEGDVDSFASGEEWPSVGEQFRLWARTNNLEPVVRCTHFPGLLILVACDGERPTRLLQLDVYDREIFRGTTLVQARALLPLMEHDEHGFRRLRAGAAGLLLVLRATPLGGRAPDEQGLHAPRELVRRDLQGAEQAAVTIGLPARALTAIYDGSWDRHAMQRFEVRAARRLLSSLAEVRTCIRRDVRRARGCALVESLERGRRVDGDRAEWLRTVARSHVVDPAPTPSPHGR